MKKMLFALGLVCLSMSAKAQTVLPSGTVVTVQITNEVTSKNAAELAQAAVLSDVSVGGQVLVKAGAPVMLQVEKTKARGVGRAGVINIVPVSTVAVDGSVVPLNATPSNYEGDKKLGKAVGLGVGLGVCVFPPLLACLAIKGGQAKVPAGTLIPNVRVANDCTVK
ncbi:MAG: hypothetical protein HUK02_02770 [Bacteroidaceae bacterium]|nr:hypothetical protein [Bacteroidaceae bacterium]